MRKNVIRTLIVSLFALFILVVCIIAYFKIDRRIERDLSKSWSGADLSFASGKGEARDGSLTIQTLSQKGDAFVFMKLDELRANDYATITVNIDGLSKYTKAALLWGRMSEPGESYTAPLERSFGNFFKVRFHTKKDWRDFISGFGVLVWGRLQDPVTIKSIELKPKSFSSIDIFYRLWQDVSYFEEWSQRSAHFIRGEKRDALFHPLPFVAGWIVLSSGLYFLLARFVFRVRHEQALVKDQIQIDIFCIGLLFLIGWLALDLRWQVHLWHQLNMTRHQFAGKTLDQKHLAGDDRKLYSFIQQLKQASLPKTPTRIFILSNDPVRVDKYRRLKAHYYLLPHNVSSHAKYPPITYVEGNDYLLKVTDIDGLSYSSQEGVLRWHKDKQLNVLETFKSPEGTLYRIRE